MDTSVKNMAQRVLGKKDTTYVESQQWIFEFHLFPTHFSSSAWKRANMLYILLPSTLTITVAVIHARYSAPSATTTRSDEDSQRISCTFFTSLCATR